MVVLVAVIVLVLLLVSAAITDLWRRKIYNLQTYPAMACGLILGYAGSGWHGVSISMLGLLAGLTLLLLFYLMGGMGAGDVKLLGAIGALKGASFVTWTMFYTGLVGGMMAFALLIWQGKTIKTLKSTMRFIRHPIQFQKEKEEAEYQYIPYGLAISLGGFWALFTV